MAKHDLVKREHSAALGVRDMNIPGVVTCIPSNSLDDSTEADVWV